MWWRSSYHPTAYDDDWEDQPTQSWFHQWILGLVVPCAMIGYSTVILRNSQAEIGADITTTIHGSNAVAYAIAVLSAGVFLHCHYFWGNIYDQAWFAVLGKIISACTFIASLGFLCVHLGVLGR